MTADEISDAWNSQPVFGRKSGTLGEIIASKQKATRRQLRISAAIAVFAVVMAVVNFYGQYVQNENGLWISILRALPALVATPIHWGVCRRLATERHEQQQLAASHDAWLSQSIGRLQSEIQGKGAWKLGLFFAFVIAITSATKWIDFQSGQDSAAECVGILLAVVTLCLGVSIGIWHHRTQFLVPELDRCRRLLTELRVDG